MANQTIPGLSTISAPSSAAMLWITDPNASPQDRSLSLQKLNAFLMAKGTALGSGATPYTLAAPYPYNPYLISTGASNFVFNLPAATGSGLMIDIKKVDSGAGLVQIAPNGSNVIDRLGNVSLYLGYQYQGVRLTDIASGYWELQPLGKRTWLSGAALGTLAGGLDIDAFSTGSQTITLPANPTLGQRITVKNKGAYTTGVKANTGQHLGYYDSATAGVFTLYAQDDYVTLEYELSTLTWSVIETNGPIASALQTSGGLITGGGSAWVAIDLGMKLTLAPGVYDVEVSFIVKESGSGNVNQAYGIGIGTTPANLGKYSSVSAQNNSGTERMTVRASGIIVTASGTLNAMLFEASNYSTTVTYDATLAVGYIMARRIG